MPEIVQEQGIFTTESLVENIRRPVIQKALGLYQLDCEAGREPHPKSFVDRLIRVLVSQRHYAYGQRSEEKSSQSFRYMISNVVLSDNGYKEDAFVIVASTNGFSSQHIDIPILLKDFQYLGDDPEVAETVFQTCIEGLQSCAESADHEQIQ